MPQRPRGRGLQGRAFDVALCSETLEHVSDFRAALRAAARACRAVVITIPHESEQQVDHNRASGELHAHINRFQRNTLGFPKRKQALRVIAPTDWGPHIHSAMCSFQICRWLMRTLGTSRFSVQKRPFGP